MSSLELRSRSVGEWSTNSYALVCPTTRESVLIDPGAAPDDLLEMLQGTHPVAILLTHTHPDHVGALEGTRSRLGVVPMLHPGPHFEGAEFPGARALNDGDMLRVGEHRLTILYAPGHTPDQICIAIQDDPRVFVGDAIFDGGPGHTATVQDFQTTLRTLRNVVLHWPDDTVCYPGHGASFRLGDIRSAVERFVATPHPGFSGDATWDMA